MFARRCAAFLAAAALAVGLAACTGSNDPSVNTSTGGISGGTGATDPDAALNVIVPSVDDEDTDPILFKSAGQHSFYPLIYDSLVGRDVKTGGYGPGLATSWNQAADGTSWTFHLRPGVKFQDGSPLTATDVKFTIERYMGKFGAVAATGSTRIADAIKEIQVVDPVTVKMITPKGDPTMLSDMSPDPGSAAGYVVPEAYIKKVGNAGFNKAPIGTGPFKMTSQTRGQNMVFARNAAYWGDKAGVAKITLSIVSDASQRISMLQTGRADIVSGIVGPAITRVSSMSDVKLISASKGALVYLVMGNGTNPKSPLSKLDVRNAISMAIDRGGIVKSLLGGHGSPAYLLGWPVATGWPSDAAKYTTPYDVTKAKQLLASAGYPNGFKLKLWTSTEGRDFAQAMAQNLGSIGVKVSLQTAETAQVTAQMGDPGGKNSDRAVLVYGPAGSPSRLDMGGYFTTYLGTDQTNTQPFDDPALSGMVTDQATQSDQSKRNRELSQILTTSFTKKEGPIALWYVDTLFAVDSKVSKWTVIPGMAYPQNLQSVTMKKG
jgi:peptide/nickel transport system substrate-binding protein